MTPKEKNMLSEVSEKDDYSNKWATVYMSEKEVNHQIYLMGMFCKTFPDSFLFGEHD